MSYIVFVAMIAAAALAFQRTPGRALLSVWLPVLLLVPDTFHCNVPGLPDPSFNQAAVLPIIIAALLRYGGRWRPSLSDALIASFTGLIGYSEYLASGYAEAQNLMFATVASMMGPYCVARLVIAAEDLDIAVARRFVWLSFLVGLIGLYEARFGLNPFIEFWRIFFPGQGFGWVTTFRYGIARVAGPYAHAILAGIMMVVAYHLQRWLERNGHWESAFARFALPWPKARVITVVLFVASLMTVARGPWIGGIAAAVVIAAGAARQRKRWLRALAIALPLAALLGWLALMAYLDVKPGIAISASQESAMYRKVLIDKYIDIALDHALFGWGRNSWPKVDGMVSIDNYYLLLSLMHGVLATLLLVLVMLWLIARLLRRGLREAAQPPSLSFALAGIFIAIAISLATVYLGEQVVPMFFFLCGWAESRLQRPLQAERGADAGEDVKRPRFRRVIQ